MNNLLLINSIMDKINEWNKDLNKIFEQYLSTPWAGSILFLVILFVAWGFIRNNSNK